MSDVTAEDLKPGTRWVVGRKERRPIKIVAIKDGFTCYRYEDNSPKRVSEAEIHAQTAWHILHLLNPQPYESEATDGDDSST